MRRREFITLLGGAAASWPLAARAQRGGNVATVGILWHAGSVEEEAVYFAQIQKSLEALGYIEGRNITLLNTFADEQYERFNSNAAELVRRKVDVLVAVTLPAALAAQRATNTIPIVFILVSDPVATKLVASLAHPGRNITGLSPLADELLPKSLDLFKETVPSLSEIRFMVNPSVPFTTQRSVEEVRTAAQHLGIPVRPVEAADPSQIEQAFSSIQDGVTGVMVQADAMFFRERKQIALWGLKRKIPTLVFNSTMVEDGRMQLAGKPRFAAWQHTSIEFSKVRTLVNSRSSFPPRSNLTSISGLRRQLASPFRPRSLTSPIK
jgi:putative tryptophan/tyrosine transport system substrate-binding protein